MPLCYIPARLGCGLSKVSFVSVERHHLGMGLRMLSERRVQVAAQPVIFVQLKSFGYFRVDLCDFPLHWAAHVISIVGILWDHQG